MNYEAIETPTSTEVKINESHFFKIEFVLWATFSISLLLYWSGLSERFGILEVLLQLSVICLAIYGAIVPFVKTWYNLEDLSSAIINIAGIVLITTGATASSIYQLPWGEQVFMAGFLCTSYYHWHAPFRERTYQNTNNTEDKLIWFFVIGCLLSFPACFIHEELFPYPSTIFIYTAALGFWILSYTLVLFCIEWYKKNVRNYILLSHVPRILIMIYFAKGYDQFRLVLTFLEGFQ